MPSSPWLWRQTWHDLLFAHWPVPSAALRPLVPAWLTIQEFAGSSWVGLVPFTMTGVTLRGMPTLPILSQFPEMNLRLYVEYGGKAGVWFISLDAGRRPAVWAARVFAHLPYFFSRMRVRPAGESIDYRSVRAADRRVAFEATYRPSGPPADPKPGTLEHFLTERYCLYAASGARRYRLEIQHPPWPLQPAEARLTVNHVAQPQGIALPDTAPLLHFSRRQFVVGWGLERL